MRQLKALKAMFSPNLLRQFAARKDHLLDGRYRITQVLAQGEFGHTYLAVDTYCPDSPLRIIKRLQPLNRNPRFLPEIHRLFNTEAEKLKRLEVNHCISRLWAHFEENQCFYLVQDYIQGQPLSQELIPGQPLSGIQVVQLLQEILNILTFIHSQGIIHQDLKPENLIRRQSDRKLVLIDFGAIKAVKVTTGVAQLQSNLCTVIGTRAYMPIEQLAGNPQLNSDLYAAGVIGIQAASGLTVATLQYLLDPNAPDANLGQWQERVFVPPGFVAILERMVHPDYRERYQSAADVLTDLERLRANPVLLSPAPEPAVLNRVSPLPELPLLVPRSDSSSPGLAATRTSSPTRMLLWVGIGVALFIGPLVLYLIWTQWLDHMATWLQPRLPLNQRSPVLPDRTNFGR